MNKITKKNLKNILKNIYRCSFYKSVDVYLDDGNIYFVACGNNASSYCENARLIGRIEFVENFGRCYLLTFVDYMGNEIDKDLCTVDEILEHIKRY